MPLYMDIHLAGEELDLEELREAHEKDLKVQQKYGVQHKHYYVNTKEGVAFCLMSGPDKESCIAVHIVILPSFPGISKNDLGCRLQNW